MLLDGTHGTVAAPTSIPGARTALTACGLAVMNHLSYSSGCRARDVTVALTRRHAEEDAEVSEKAAARGTAGKKAGGSPKKEGEKGGDKAATAVIMKAAQIAESILEPISAKASGGDDEKVQFRVARRAPHRVRSWSWGGHRGVGERTRHLTADGAWPEP